MCYLSFQYPHSTLEASHRGSTVSHQLASHNNISCIHLVSLLSFVSRCPGLCRSTANHIDSQRTGRLKRPASRVNFLIVIVCGSRREIIYLTAFLAGHVAIVLL